MNCLNAVGRLGRDPETRFTQGGKAVTTLAIAIDSGWGDNKKTTWLNAGLWGRDGQEHGLVKHLSKGSQVAVTGEITLEEYDKKDGTKGSSLKLHIQNLTPIGGKGSESTPAQKPVKEKAATESFEDDIPF